MFLIRLWIVTYQKENGFKTKCRFYAYEDKNTGQRKYFIKRQEDDKETEVTKDQGNDYYKEILKYDRKAIVNRIY